MLSLLNPEPGVDFAGHMGGVMVGLTLGLAFAAEDSSLRMYFNIICFN
jgi:membrane associated rhomboid family serine protease